MSLKDRQQLLHLFMIKVTVFDWRQQAFCHDFCADILTRDTEEAERKEEEKYLKLNSDLPLRHTMSMQLSFHPSIKPSIYFSLVIQVQAVAAG